MRTIPQRTKQFRTSCKITYLLFHKDKIIKNITVEDKTLGYESHKSQDNNQIGIQGSYYKDLTQSQ